LFAPTSTSASNLISERCPGQIEITGNTGIDALLLTLGFRAKPPRHWPAGSFNILVTCHRRENWGDGFAAVAAALIELSRRPRLKIDVVLHPNPRVSEAMFHQLGRNASIRLLPPLSHPAMLEAMLSSDLILSDSGGVQEEAPTLGVPLLVLREKTERPEGVEQGAMRLVGTDARRIVAAVDEIVGDRKLRAAMSQQRFPFGDGRAAPRIAAAAMQWLDREERERAESRRA
jgi:UDP-N-acetylglucosamine 2-epimerase (non-hydrolysing)